MKRLILILLALFLLVQNGQAQEQTTLYLPLILKDTDMSSYSQWAVFDITDGTAANSVSLLRGKLPGFQIKEWQPKIIQSKGGGTYQDSSLASGRRLVSAVYASANETLPLAISHYNQNDLILQVQDFVRLLLASEDYWLTDRQSTPIYIRARSQNETNTRYALIHGFELPELGEVFAQPFQQIVSRIVSMENLTLSLERGHWLANPPGEDGSCVQVSNQQSWDHTLDLTASTETAARMVTGFARHSGSGAIYAVSAERRIMKSTDAGVTFSDHLTGSPTAAGDDFRGVIALANNNIIAYGVNASSAAVYRTTNDGSSWTAVGEATMRQIRHMIQVPATGTVIAVGLSSTSNQWAIWRSTNNGGSFTRVFTFIGAANTLFHRVAVADNGDIIAIGSNGAAWRSTNDGSSWVRTTTIGDATSAFEFKAFIKASDGSLYAVSAKSVSAIAKSWIWRSTDNGSTWKLWYFNPYTALMSLTETATAGEFYGSALEITTGFGEHYLWRSSNYGLSWQNLGQMTASAGNSVSTLHYGVFHNTTLNKVLAGSGEQTSAGLIYRTSASTLTTLGRAATCNNEVYVANKNTFANLTHIYRDDGGVFTSIYPMGAFPTSLYPATPAANDALYLGIKSSVANAGPFSGLIFDIATGLSGDCVITWEYWNGAWTALSVQDNTNGFSTTGVRGVHWAQPSDWATTAVNSVTAYWVRARISSLSGTVTVPTQQNRQIYATNQAWGQIEAAQVKGDIPAIAEIKSYNQSDLDGPGGSAPDLYANRVVAGLRSTSRGDSFSAYINLADEQNIPGISIALTTPGTEAQFQDDATSPTGRRLTYQNSAGTSPMTTRALISLSTDLSRDFYGTYHAFLRGQRSGGAAADIGIRLQIATGSGGVAFTTRTEQFQTTTAFEVLDFGQITIPVSGSFKSSEISDITEIRIQTSAANATTAVNLYDLILIPVDEWAGDFVDPANTSTSDVGRSNGIAKLLDVDSITDPRNPIRALVRTADDEFVTGEYNAIAGGEAMLQCNAQQRLWFFALRTSATGSSYSWLAPPELVHSVQIFANPRYLGLRGSR